MMELILNVNQSASITVVSPNTGSEVWYEGNQVSILWNSTNVVVEFNTSDAPTLS